jgi:hypothetical protein
MPRESRERLGELYRRARGDRTQAWLAAQLLARGFTIDQSAVSDAELGKRAINMLEVAAFAEVLGLARKEIVRALANEYDYVSGEMVA